MVHRKAAAIVFDSHPDTVLDRVEGHVYAAGTRVLRHVGETFLDDAEQDGLLFGAQALATDTAH